MSQSDLHKLVADEIDARLEISERSERYRDQVWRPEALEWPQLHLEDLTEIPFLSRIGALAEGAAWLQGCQVLPRAGGDGAPSAAESTFSPWWPCGAPRGVQRRLERCSGTLRGVSRGCFLGSQGRVDAFSEVC